MGEGRGFRKTKAGEKGRGGWEGRLTGVWQVATKGGGKQEDAHGNGGNTQLEGRGRGGTTFRSSGRMRSIAWCAPSCILSNQSR